MAAVAPLLALSGVASAAPQRDQASLRCGGTTFRLETVSEAKPPVSVLWWSQRLTVGDGVPVPLVDVQPPVRIRRAGLSAVITGWACLAGDKREVLMLGYTCKAEGAKVCGGQEEWSRFIGPGGQPLDKGYAPLDPRLPALLDQLGLGKQSEAGIPMRSVTR